MELVVAALAAVVVFTAAVILRSGWERRQLCIEKYNIDNASVKDKMRIAFICDVHDRLNADGIRKLVASVHETRPDIVLLGGDIITLTRHSGELPDAQNAARLIAGLSLECPVFYAEGNHELKFRERYSEEFEAFIKKISELGAIYIRDGHVTFGDASIFSVSLEGDYYRRMKPGFGNKKQMPEDYLSSKLGEPDSGRMNILLLHNPMYLKEAADWGADLVLSGHFHGGTIRLPFMGGLMTPQYQFFIKECAGLHEHGDAKMIVSRGIGTHSVNIRLNDMPELSIIDINAS